MFMAYIQSLPTSIKQFAMKKIILIFNLILWTSIMYGQYNIIPSENLMAEFLKRYKRDTDNAFDFIFGKNELIGAEEFIDKPAEPELLLKTIEKYLNGKD